MKMVSKDILYGRLEKAIIKRASELGYEFRYTNIKDGRFRILLDIENKFSNNEIKRDYMFENVFTEIPKNERIDILPDLFKNYVFRYNAHYKTYKEDFGNIYYMISDLFHTMISKLSEVTNKSHLIGNIFIAKKTEDIDDSIFTDLLKGIDKETQDKIIKDLRSHLYYIIFNYDYYTEYIAKAIRNECFGKFVDSSKYAEGEDYDLPKVLFNLKESKKQFEKFIGDEFTILYKNSIYLVKLLDMLEFIRQKDSNKFEKLFSNFYEHYKLKLIKQSKAMYLYIYKNRNSLLNDKNSYKYQFLTEGFINDLWYCINRNSSLEWLVKDLINEIDLNGIEELSSDEIEELKIFIFNSSFYNVSRQYYRLEEHSSQTYDIILKNIFGDKAELMKKKIFNYDLNQQANKIVVKNYKEDFYDKQFLYSLINSDFITQKNLTGLIEFFRKNYDKYDINILLNSIPENLKEEAINYIVNIFNNLSYDPRLNNEELYLFILFNLDNINIDEDIIETFMKKLIKLINFDDYKTKIKVMKRNIK